MSSILPEKRKVFKVEEDGSVQYFKEYSFEEANRFRVSSLNLWKDANYEHHNAKFRFLFDELKQKSKDITDGKASSNMDLATAVLECQQAAGEISQLLALTSELRAAEAIKVQSLNHFVPRAIKLPSEQCIFIKRDGILKAGQYLQRNTSSLLDRVNQRHAITKQIIELAKSWQFAQNRSSHSTFSSSSNYLHVDCSYGQCGDDEDISIAYVVPLYAPLGSHTLQLSPEELTRSVRSKLVTLTWSLVHVPTKAILAFVSDWTDQESVEDDLHRMVDGDESIDPLRTLHSYLSKRRHDCFSRRLFHYLRNPLAHILNTLPESSTTSGGGGGEGGGISVVRSGTAVAGTRPTSTSATTTSAAMSSGIEATWATTSNLFCFDSSPIPTKRDAKTTAAMETDDDAELKDEDAASMLNKILHVHGDKSIPVFAYDQSRFSVGLCEDVAMQVSLTPLDSAVSRRSKSRGEATGKSREFEQLLRNTRDIAENALLHHFHKTLERKKKAAAAKLAEESDKKVTESKNTIAPASSKGSTSAVAAAEVEPDSLPSTVFTAPLRFLRVSLLRNSLRKLGDAMVSALSETLSLDVTAKIADVTISAESCTVVSSSSIDFSPHANIATSTEKTSPINRDLFSLPTVPVGVSMTLSIANGTAVTLSRQLRRDTYFVSANQDTQESSQSAGMTVGMHGVVDAVIVSVLQCALRKSLTSILHGDAKTQPKSKHLVTSLTASTIAIYRIHGTDELPTHVVSSLGSVCLRDLQTLSCVLHLTPSAAYVGHCRRIVESSFRTDSHDLSAIATGVEDDTTPVHIHVDFADETRRNVFLQSVTKATPTLNLTVHARPAEHFKLDTKHSQMTSEFHGALIEYKSTSLPGKSESKSSSAANKKRKGEVSSPKVSAGSTFDLTAALDHLVSVLIHFT